MSSSKIQALKERTFRANMNLTVYGLVKFTWGNVSEIDRDLRVVAIKPSGVSYDALKKEDMVVLSLAGEIVEGTLRPSSDTPTHLELYRKFTNIGGVVHTHSVWATPWAQAGKGIPCYGTTHADYFYGTVPCTRQLTEEEVTNEYELNTGKVIVETFARNNVNPIEMPGVLVKNHGPFTWGKDAHEAIHNAVVLDEISRMALQSLQINANLAETPAYVVDKHYQRKHGKNAYYGQK